MESRTEVRRLTASHRSTAVVAQQAAELRRAGPAGYVDGVNLYAYVRNNPLKYTDPLGRKVSFVLCLSLELQFPFRFSLSV